MKKYFIIFLIVISMLSIFNVHAKSSAEPPMFLLGQNEIAEVIISGKATSLEIGKNPIQLITASEGRKMILCAGETKKSGEIIQGASLRILAPDFQKYEKTFQCESALTAYTLNNDLTAIWLATKGGAIDKAIVQPKVYRVSLESFDMTEVTLDSIPCDVVISGDGKWLAVAELGGAETPHSTLTLYDANSMAPAGRFEISKNPGAMFFSNDNHTIMVAGYGYKYHEGFTIPTVYSVKLEQPVSAGVDIIDLASLESKKIDLGFINNEFIFGDNGTIYGITSEKTNEEINDDPNEETNQEVKGNVKAIGFEGLLWEQACDFAPKFVQERPATEQVWISGGKKVRIIDKPTGKILKDITVPNEIKPFLFLENHAYAYAYNMNKRKLNILHLNNLLIEDTLGVGSTGLAVMKVMAVAASFVNYYNSLQPQYVNGVRMPTNVQPIYWVHSPKGNIVACPEKNKLYMLNSFLAQIHTYDMQTGKVDKKLGNFGQNSMYLQ
ncbi:MAG: YncE family protein, partial [Bacteroidota bacterium]